MATRAQNSSVFGEPRGFGQPGGDQFSESGGGGAPSLHDLVVVERAIPDASREVGHERQPGHPQAEGASLQGFQNGGHADGVRPEHPQHADFRRSLILRAAQSGIDPVAEDQPRFIRRDIERASHLHIVGAGHILEIRCPFKRRGAGEIEMIGDAHERARRPIGVDAACRVREQQTTNARAVHQTNDGPDVAGGMAFIEMDTTGCGQQRNPVDLVADEFSTMARHRRRGQTRNTIVGEFAGDGETIEPAAESGSEHDTDLRGEFFWKHEGMMAARRRFRKHLLFRLRLE